MTATQTQLRRGTAAQVAGFTPAANELVVNTTDKRLHLGDGLTAGGIPHASAADIQKQSFSYSTVGGTGNAITLTNSPAVSALANGLRLTFKATNTNTGATTVAVDGLTAKNIYKLLDGALTALVAGDIISGGIYEIIYDGTQFQIKGLANTTPSPGSYVFLGQRVASASATLDFTSLMTADYDTYVFDIIDLRPATDNVALHMRTSTDNGANWDSSAGAYYWRTDIVALDGTSTAPTLASSTTSATEMTLAPGVGNAANEGVSGEVVLRGVNGTTRRKAIHFEGEAEDPSGITRLIRSDGHRNNAANIDAARFYFSSGNITSGTINLYGLKNS